jgi:hypothetical protein
MARGPKGHSLAPDKNRFRLDGIRRLEDRRIVSQFKQPSRRLSTYR